MPRRVLRVLPDHWKGLLTRVRTEIAADNLVLLAAGVAFFALLSIVPAFAATVAIWGLFAQPEDVTRFVEDFAAALPDSARETLEEQLEIVAGASGAGLGLTALVGILVALWSASTATKYLLQAVAAAYGESTERSYVRFRGLALLFTLGAIAFALVTVAVIALLPASLARTELGDATRLAANWLRWPLLAAAMMITLSIVYRVAPRRNQRLTFASVGAVAATVVWLAGSALFAWYAANFGNFNRTYGSMGGVIVLMLWFFLTAFVVVLGAEVNVVIEQAAREASQGERAGTATRADDRARW